LPKAAAKNSGLFYVQGCTVFAKEPGMAVWLCTGMYGIRQRARDGRYV